jgi:hypothetical protein
VADTSNPSPAKPAAKPETDAVPTVTVVMDRDYWPKGARPADLPEDGRRRYSTARAHGASPSRCAFGP